ncbi:Hypp2990 [Branchiostoma lanceolatum]|uniref:Hypp2990 protein n=1 Tax=Branchiostoma lanceolatum TaxID=7740 RepID=A0A8J9ZYI8_BRALA|nr:Hypp2990 [Branchiostoma lanceolatum]
MQPSMYRDYFVQQAFLDLYESKRRDRLQVAIDSLQPAVHCCSLRYGAAACAAVLQNVLIALDLITVRLPAGYSCRRAGKLSFITLQGRAWATLRHFCGSGV